MDCREVGTQTDRALKVDAGTQVERSQNTLKAVEAVPKIVEQVQRITNQQTATAHGVGGSASTHSLVELADHARPAATARRWRSAQGEAQSYHTHIRSIPPIHAHSHHSIQSDHVIKEAHLLPVNEFHDQDFLNGIGKDFLKGAADEIFECEVGE